jgi:hypothetical protein
MKKKLIETDSTAKKTKNENYLDFRIYVKFSHAYLVLPHAWGNALELSWIYFLRGWRK